jgi:hypothetical protein
VHLVDDRGRVLDAEYHVEADDGHLTLIVESRSGMSGRRAPRNPDYNRALTILLARAVFDKSHNSPASSACRLVIEATYPL